MPPVIRRAAALLALLTPTLLAAASRGGQAPGAGWVVKPSPDGEIQQLYWDLQKQTEIWMRLEPRRPDGSAAPLYLIFSVIFDGKTAPGPATSVLVQALAGPMTIVTHASFDLQIDGDRHVSFEAPPYSPQQVIPQSYDGSMSGPTGLQLTVPIDTVRSLAAAQVIKGDVLGIAVTLDPTQIAAIGRFIERVTTDAVARVRPAGGESGVSVS